MPDSEITIGADLTERALTRTEFCYVEGISKATYYKLRRLGLGPRESTISLPGIKLARITPADRAEWHRKLEEARASEAAELEAARAHAQRVAAAKLAAASPAHVSRRPAPCSGAGNADESGNASLHCRNSNRQASPPR